MHTADLTLKDRMKSLQAAQDYKLDKDSYIICHLDGRAFSKMIKKRFNLPFDDEFMHMMDETAAYVCENVQGAKLAYVQSDEISIVITAFKYVGEEFLNCSPFFDYRLCKLQSIIASLATAKFNQLYTLRILSTDSGKPLDQRINEIPLIQFDCKCWDVKEYEDMFAWFKFRQNDCIRNSKQQFAQAYCSHKDLLNKNSDEQVVYCKLNTGNDWNTIGGQYKYGRIVYHTLYAAQTINPKTGESINVIRSKYSACPVDKPFTIEEFKSWDLVPFK